jgi:hypothetical protein
MANLKDALLKNVGYEKGQFDIKKQMAKKTFGGDDFLSSVLREKLGLEKEKKGKSPSKEGSEGLGTEATSVLTIIAKNTMVLPGMAKDMKTLSQNIQKLVKLKGGKSTSSGSDFFRKQKDKAAGKLKPGKSKSPTASVGKKVASAAPSGIMDILGNIAGFIGGALIEVVKSLFNPMMIIRLLSKLAIPLLIVGTLVSGIMAGWKKYQATGSFTDSIVSYFGGMLEFLTLGLFGEDQLKGVLESLGEIFKPVTDSVSKIFESIKGVFKNIFGDYIKIDEKPKEESKPKDGQKSPDVPKMGGSDGVAEKMTGEVSGVMEEAGLPGLPGGLGGDLGNVMDSMAKGDFKGVASQAEAMKQKYPPQSSSPPPPTPAPPSPVASAPPSAAPTPVPSKSGGSKSAELDAQWEAQYQIVKQKNVERVAAMKALVESSAYRNASEDEKAKMIKSGPAEEARIAFNTENQKLTKLAKELEAAKKSENEEPIKTEGATGGPVATPTPAPPPTSTAPTAASGGGGDKFADKAESNKLGALQFLKRTLGLLPDKDGSYIDMKNGEKKLSEEEVRSRISAAGKDPDKVLGLLKGADGGGKIDLKSGNLNTITGGAIGGGGGGGAGGGGAGGGAAGGAGASPVTPSGGGAPSGEAISSASSEVSEGQRMESAADKGGTINAGTTNNSSGSTGKPSKQTASAYDSDFAQRLATS